MDLPGEAEGPEAETGDPVVGLELNVDEDDEYLLSYSPPSPPPSSPTSYPLSPPESQPGIGGGACRLSLRPGAPPPRAGILGASHRPGATQPPGPVG